MVSLGYNNVLGVGGLQVHLHLHPHPIININCVSSNSIPKQVWRSSTTTTTLCVPKLKVKATNSQGSWAQEQQQQEEEDIKVVAAIRSQFNDILIVDTSVSRMLLLDSTCIYLLFLFLTHWSHDSWVQFWVLTHLSFCILFMLMNADNVHSILYKDQKWTGSYWVRQTLSWFLYYLNNLIIETT